MFNQVSGKINVKVLHINRALSSHYSEISLACLGATCVLYVQLWATYIFPEAFQFQLHVMLCLCAEPLH